jgi:3-deoxy-D-arabino-heptulosonate 7-phosphate (DAHP) synthase class II
MIPLIFLDTAFFLHQSQSVATVFRGHAFVLSGFGDCQKSFARYWEHSGQVIVKAH